MIPFLILALTADFAVVTSFSARERHTNAPLGQPPPIDDARFVAAVRACAGETPPPPSGQWLVAIVFGANGGQLDPVYAKGVAISAYDEPPAAVARCIAAVPSPVPEGDDFDLIALVGIRTRAYDKNAPLTDPQRVWSISVGDMKEHKNGRARDYGTFRTYAIRDAVQRCADERVPITARPLMYGFKIELKWQHPQRKEQPPDLRAFGFEAPPPDPAPFAATPKGFAECVYEKVYFKDDDFFADTWALTASVRVMTTAFADRHFVGRIGSARSSR